MEGGGGELKFVISEEMGMGDRWERKLDKGDG